MRSLRLLGGPPGPRSRSKHSLAPIRLYEGAGGVVKQIFFRESFTITTFVGNTQYRIQMRF